MKKMLVSDYDGTLNSDLKNLKMNIDAIRKFREDGNIFTISTGREYESIKKECDKYNIPYDYLNCNDGLITFDKDDNIISINPLSREDLIALTTTLHHDAGYKDVGFYDAYGRTTFTINNIKKGIQADIIEMNITRKLFNNLNRYCKSFHEHFPNIKFSYFYNEIFIKNNINKADGIRLLEEYLNGEVTHDDIIAVGDAKNDLELLQEFNGYKMLCSYPSLVGKGLKTTREVHTLVKKLTK